MTKHSRVLIIGSGAAGYTAAVYAARANLQPVVLAGIQPGGQLTITTDVENFPGFAEPVQGPWLMEQMRMQAENVGSEIIYDTVIEVDFSKRPFTLKGDSGEIYASDAVIVATGASARWLGIQDEEKYMGFGVSACATCDGFFYKGKEVAVVGGGNSAVEEALYLTNFASKVTLIHRRDSLRAEKIAQERLFKNPKTEVIWDTVVEGFIGTENPTSLTGLKLKNIQTNELSDFKVDGCFVAIGHDPATKIFKGKLEMDESGYLLKRPDRTHTSIPGVFVAGDVADHVYRQAVTAAGMGCMAALDAEKFLAEQN